MTRVFERTMTEVIDCIKYGKLYIVERIHGHKIVCKRVRNVRGDIVATSEQITVDRRVDSLMQPDLKDFVFMDSSSGGRKPAVSLLKVRRGQSVTCSLCGNPHSDRELCVCQMKFARDYRNWSAKRKIDNTSPILYGSDREAPSR